MEAGLPKNQNKYLKLIENIKINTINKRIINMI